MALPVLEVHTPSNSFAVPHSLTGDNLPSLFSRLGSKLNANVGPGWVKYEYNGAFWDLNDEADYSIFAWRLAPADASSPSPIIFVHDPLRPLPTPPSYQNFSYYIFRPKSSGEPSTPSYRQNKSSSPNPTATRAGPAGPFVPESTNSSPRPRATLQRQDTVISRARSVRSTKSKRSRPRGISPNDDDDDYDDRKSSKAQTEEEKVPKFKRDFLKFHGENGNRVVIGKFGPVSKVEMLLKKGYRHVYMSRHFAKRHGLVPPEVVPGWMGYGGLVKYVAFRRSAGVPPKVDIHLSIASMGQIPITLGTKTTTHTVYLAEENQFDVVLGRSFMEARRVQTDPTDFSSVVCMDNGDSLECKIIVIRDGRGDFVTVP